MSDAVIGVKCVGHDTSIFVLQQDGEPFGLDRERITRHKHDVGFPYEPLEMVRDSLRGKDLMFASPDVKASFRALRFASNRKIHSSNYEESLSRVRTGPLIRIGKLLRDTSPVRKMDSRKGSAIIRGNIRSVFGGQGFGLEKFDHHLSHASSAYFPSGLSRACVITMDGEGDDYSSKVYLADGGELAFVGGSDKHNSLGHVYGAFTEALGLRRDHDEGKVEALAGFGSHETPLLEKLRKRIYVRGTEIVVEKPFHYKSPDMGVYRSLVAKYGEKDSSAAIQRILEDVGVELVTNAIDEHGRKDFCFSGGCFANVQMNLRIFEETGIRSMYISPAMNDSGSAQGAAYLMAAGLGWDTSRFVHEMPYFGPSFGEKDVKEALRANKSRIRSSPEDDWPERVAELVSRGSIVGIYHGRMEYGPRALGNRSVIADARDKEVKDRINSTIKRRKPYQPFCPSVLESERERLFKESYRNKHMTCAFRMKEEFHGELPSGIHVDGTARPQFVERQDNPKYFRMLTEFKRLTGFGFVINTSFNLHGRTIVMTPQDAITDFLDCGLDYMALDGWIVERA